MIQVLPVKSTELGIDKGQLGDPIISGWDLVNMDGTSFEIKLNFTDPLSVSIGFEPDLLMVQIQLANFTDVNGNRMPPSIVKYIEIPTQMPS